MSSAPSLFSRRYLAPITASAWPMERMASYTVWDRTFLPLAMMSPRQYSAAKVERISTGSLYDRISGLRATLAQQADQIVQCLLVEAALEAERTSEMASVVAQKLYSKRCCWTGYTCAMVVAGGSV